jgi:hypothetical protein
VIGGFPMLSLTSLLARDGVVSLDTIEQALQRQVLEGGEIDTALLELSAAPENVLGAYRAASMQLPPASRAQLERISRSLLARVPSELAREYHVLPIAAEDELLVLATDAPPPLVDVQRISRELGTRVSFRIATELRIHVALAAHYQVEIPSRLRLLYEKLQDRDPGELCEVQPWTPSRPAPATPHEPETRSVRERWSERASQSAPPPPPVRVVQVVALGGTLPARPSAPLAVDDPRETRPVRPSSKLPATDAPGSTKRNNRVRRGPLTGVQAIELLGQAHDRDRVLEVFFAFARQYFECAVLFALRDERLLGLDGSGLPSSIDLRSVEVALPRGGSLYAITLSRAPQVLDLRSGASDRALVSAIGREQAQPCVVIPVTIRQRIVSLLYGDRGGESIDLSELSDVLHALPAVSTAFERIIHERKLHAVEARRNSKRPSPPPPIEALPTGAFATSPKAPSRETPLGIAPSTANTFAGLSNQASQDRSSRGSRKPGPPPEVRDALLRHGQAPASPRSTLGMRGDAPPPPRLPAEAPELARAAERELVERPTVQLSTATLTPGIPPGPKIASQAPPKSASYSQHNAPMDQVRARHRGQDTTRPERPSNRPGPRSRASAAPRPLQGAVADPPPPRTLSQPAPGTGSYALHDEIAESVRKEPALLDAQPSAAEHEQTERGAGTASRPPRADARREEGGAPSEREVVSISAAVQKSLRPPQFEPDEGGAQSIVVDLGAEAERLVDELCRSGPDDERPLVAALLRLGETALPALKRRFPGPLWFDRQKPRQRMPAGRDVSAVARALFAFEELAVPHLAELLESPQVDVRLCATLVAADSVRPSLLWPLYQRLFDADGQVRLLAFETLPLYRHVKGFDEVRKSLRVKAADEREAIPARLSAIEAISVLRDPGSVELLIGLCHHESRQLSVPAHRSLLAITGQDFGDSDRKWKSWYDKNKTRPRAEWLIDSLMHSEERMRNLAAVELQKLTQVYYGFVASASKRERERAQRRYRDWWTTTGRTQFRS